MKLRSMKKSAAIFYSKSLGDLKASRLPNGLELADKHWWKISEESDRSDSTRSTRQSNVSDDQDRDIERGAFRDLRAKARPDGATNDRWLRPKTFASVLPVLARFWRSRPYSEGPGTPPDEGQIRRRWKKFHINGKRFVFWEDSSTDADVLADLTESEEIDNNP